MTLDEQLTGTPQLAKLVMYREDDITGLKYAVFHFNKARDFYPFHGPLDAEFYATRSGKISFNVCNKPYTAFYRKSPNPDGPLVAESGRAAFKNPRYASGEEENYGPLYVVADEDDTTYFCIQTTPAFDPLEFEIFDLKEGEEFDSSKYTGYCLAVLEGNLKELPWMGFAHLSSGKSLTALEDSKIVVVRPVENG